MNSQAALFSTSVFNAARTILARAGPAVLALGVVASACGGGSGGNSNSPTSPTPPATTTAPPVTVPAACFSFTPARPEVSATSQRVSLQVVATSSACSWAPTRWDDWLSLVRVGPLYQTGNGSLTIDLDANGSNGCATTARTGRITVAEEVSGRQAVLELVQQGARGPFQAPTGCSAAVLPYGITTAGSLVGNDCK